MVFCAPWIFIARDTPTNPRSDTLSRLGSIDDRLLRALGIKVSERKWPRALEGRNDGS